MKVDYVVLIVIVSIIVITMIFLRRPRLKAHNLITKNFWQDEFLAATGNSNDSSSGLSDETSSVEEPNGCICEGGICSISVVYTGVDNAVLMALDQNQDVLETFTNVSTGDTLIVDNICIGDDSSESKKKQKKKDDTSNTMIFLVDADNMYEVDTSCSVDILGLVLGPFIISSYTDSLGNVCGVECESVVCMTPDPPTMLDPATYMVIETGNPLILDTNPSPPELFAPGWCNNYTAVNLNVLWDQCNSVRQGTPAQLNSAGVLRIASSNVTNGGYIMKSVHQDLYWQVPAENVPYTTAMTQAEYDAGEEFVWFMGIPVGETPQVSNIEVTAVSEWVNLNAQYTLDGDIATITWEPLGEICDEWEIVVSIRDESEVCTHPNPEWTFQLGRTVSSASTQLTLQLNSGPTSPPHNITHCSAYAYPLCNQSNPTIIPVNTCAD